MIPINILQQNVPTTYFGLKLPYMKFFKNDNSSIQQLNNLCFRTSTEIKEENDWIAEGKTLKKISCLGNISFP